MKKPLYAALFLLGLFLFISPVLQADEAVETTVDDYDIIYFYEPLCSDCQTVEQSGVLEQLETEGYDLLQVNVDESDMEAVTLFTSFLTTYDTDESYPIVFAGEDVYAGANTIIQAVENGEIQASSHADFLEIQEPLTLEGWSGFFTVLVAGLLDGINPCAIGMLLMFVSMIGFLKSKRLMVLVSTAYISGVLLTYFAVGFGILQFLGSAFMQSVLVDIGHILYIIFGVLAFLLFLITFYDFIVTKRSQYAKVKNQLPSKIRQFNQRVMKRMTAVLQDENPSLKRKINIFLIPFFIGIVIGVTEAACTGQIYFFVLVGLNTVNPTLGIIYLIIFNLLFALPLFVIAFTAIRIKNVTAIANFVNARLPLIKILTALFFLGMAIFFFVYALL